MIGFAMIGLGAMIGLNTAAIHRMQAFCRGFMLRTMVPR
jgi:hypothetical protein